MTETTMELLLALAKEEGQHSNIEGTSCTPTPSQCTNYYQSVFRIDGQPILPPLMTKEKRFEMMKFKEVAIEREAQKRQQRQSSNEQTREAEDTVTHSQVSESNVNVQSTANRFYDALHTQPLNDTPKLNCEPKKYINASTCTDTGTGIIVESKRVQHLQRSETIIYDNRCNSIIMPLTALHQLRQGGQALMLAEESEKVFKTPESMSLMDGATSKTMKTQSPKIFLTAEPISPKRPQSLSFDTSGQAHQQQIPAICVNPPTPQVDTRLPSALHTHNFVDVSPKCAAESRQLDDKCECLKSPMQGSSNDSSKVNQFKKSATTSVNMKTKSPCCDDKLKRSITSPSLKIVGKSATHAVNNQKNESLNISSMSDEKAQCLTRSNSFTLERPSKVLLEHMERQQTQSQTSKQNYSPKSTEIIAQKTQPQQQLLQKQQYVAQTRSPNNGNLSHHAHFRRDTVESKAKRVNKIEVKQRVASVRNTAKFKQKATVTTTRPIATTSNIYRATVSAISSTSPNASSSLIAASHIAHPVSPSNAFINNNTHQIYGNSNSHSLPRNNSSNTTTQLASVPTLPLNKNKRTVCEPRSFASQPQQPQAEQLQLPIKRPLKKVTNTARTPPATLTSRALVNTTQRAGTQPQQQTGQQLHQQKQQPTANYNTQHDQHANSQTLPQQMQLTHSQQLQLKLQQLQQQRQMARSTLSPTIMSQQMLSEIETVHRSKFMQLIAQQHEEQRRLQAQFDAQQKLLLEQICTEMSTSQLSGDDGHLSGGEYTTDSETKYNQHNESNSSTSDSPGDSVSSVVDTIQCRDNSKSLTSPPATIKVSHIAKIETNTIQSGDSTTASTPRSVSTSIEHDRSGCNPQTPDDSSLHLNNNGNSGDGSGVHSARKRLHFGKNCRDSTTAQQLDFVLISDRPIQPNRHTLPRSSTGSLPETKRPTDQTPSITTTTTRSQTINEIYLQEQAAATKINAGARGYLVRRLFRTEQIQRIVQTIRDTLIFVLNLHLETSNKDAMGADEDTPANVRLKARLLQQLCSASRTLHLVFFQTTLKERMEIIARDRKRLKAKMMAISLKRTHITK